MGRKENNFTKLLCLELSMDVETRHLFAVIVGFDVSMSNSNSKNKTTLKKNSVCVGFSYHVEHVVPDQT